MGREAPETCRATHKCQVINLWNYCILLVDLFESYDDARTCECQKAVYDILKNCHWPEFDWILFTSLHGYKNTRHFMFAVVTVAFWSTVLQSWNTFKEIFHNNTYQCHVPLSISNSAEPPNKDQWHSYNKF